MLPSAGLGVHDLCGRLVSWLFLGMAFERGYRRYELREIDGRPMLVRNEIDRCFDLAE